MTGQGILLRRDDDRGRRHAVPVRPRPRAAERPLRAERRRRARRGLPPARATASSRPAPGRCCAEAVELLERIVDDRGAAGRDRRRHVRPDEAAGRRGKGLDGVVAHAPTATTTRRPSCSEGRPMSSASRGRTAATPGTPDERSSARTATPPATAWCSCPSPCRCRTTSGPRAPPCSWPPRWAWSRRWSCTPRRWGRTSPSSSSTARCTTWST